MLLKIAEFSAICLIIISFPILAGVSHLSKVLAVFSFILNILGVILFSTNYNDITHFKPFYITNHYLSHHINLFYMFSTGLLIICLFSATAVSFVFTITNYVNLYIANTIFSTVSFLTMFINTFIYYRYIEPERTNIIN